LECFVVFFSSICLSDNLKNPTVFNFAAPATRKQSATAWSHEWYDVYRRKYISCPFPFNAIRKSKWLKGGDGGREIEVPTEKKNKNNLPVTRTIRLYSNSKPSFGSSFLFRKGGSQFFIFKTEGRKTRVEKKRERGDFNTTTTTTTWTQKYTSCNNVGALLVFPLEVVLFHLLYIHAVCSGLCVALEMRTLPVKWSIMCVWDDAGLLRREQLLVCFFFFLR
jgi:hypothetical protein